MNCHRETNPSQWMIRGTHILEDDRSLCHGVTAYADRVLPRWDASNGPRASWEAGAEGCRQLPWHA